MCVCVCVCVSVSVCVFLDIDDDGEDDEFLDGVSHALHLIDRGNLAPALI